MRTDPTTCLLIIAKSPAPGRVKTRLTPPLSPTQAAELAEAALSDTLETVSKCPLRRRILVLEGEVGNWLPAGFDVVPQQGDGLDQRLAHAFELDNGPSLLLGMDTPQVNRHLLDPVLAPGAWEDVDAWFGPASDGGFWALGFKEPRPDLVQGVPMSREDTGAIQRKRLERAGLRVRDLPVLTDVDTVADIAEVAALADGGAFASAAKALEVAR